MRIVNTETGRVVRLLPLEEIRPLGGIHPPTVLRMVSERYDFSSPPQLQRPWEEAQKDGLKFQLGKLAYGNRTIYIGDFTLYNDGLVATSTSTDDAGIFLDDLFKWSKEVLGFRDIDPGMVRNLYVSNIIVELKSSPDLLLKNFTSLSESLAKLLSATYELDIPVQVSGLEMNFDRTATIPAWQTLSPFTLDRRINQPYSKNIFFSGAPLRTKDHLAFLELMESTLTSGPTPSQKKGKKALEYSPSAPRAIDLT